MSHRELAVVGHGSEEEGGGEQDPDADPEDLSLFLQHVVLLIEVVGQFDGSGEDVFLAALGGDVSHWFVGVGVFRSRMVSRGRSPRRRRPR